MTETKCRGCGVPLVFVASRSTGKAMPLEAELISIVTSEGEVVRGRIPHFARCPKAADFRRR